MGRTFGFAFSTQFAFIGIDKCKIILHNNGLVRTYLETFTAANAGNSAILPGGPALVLVHAGYIYLFIALPAFSEFEQESRTCFHTGPARSALVLVNNRQSCDRVHMQGIKTAHNSAITQTETAVHATRITAV
jgi:hypothetical protein